MMYQALYVSEDNKMKLTESKLRKIIREIIREGFAGPLSKSEQKQFESDRKKNSEVLGYKLASTPDVKTEIGLAEIFNKKNNRGF